jgi:hypothetical protein
MRRVLPMVTVLYDWSFRIMCLFKYRVMARMAEMKMSISRQTLINFTIDNSLAERSIHPMTEDRKNSLFFCSTEGAKASAIFHTIIETCKLLGISARDYIIVFSKKSH